MLYSTGTPSGCESPGTGCTFGPRRCGRALVGWSIGWFSKEKAARAACFWKIDSPEGSHCHGFANRSMLVATSAIPNTNPNDLPVGGDEDDSFVQKENLRSVVWETPPRPA
mmetsp:Transcript_17510/g.39970  ORF Transcript_17510/g.39970 Transcript_17510/m.39970 type:complete len:111 (-) Transcript_17510:245-577(-)